jgi:hypothetical protein
VIHLVTSNTKGESMSDYKPFGLLAEMLKQPSNKKATKRAFDYTLEFNECKKCGTTWAIDEGDACGDCI